MAHYDAHNSECLVYSYKDGLLAKLAHDLKLRVGRFSIEVDEVSRAVVATFDPASIEVVCARVNGRDDPGTLSAGDIRKIHGNIEKDVLRIKRHPQVRFSSDSVGPQGEGFQIRGELTLHGKHKTIFADVVADGDHLKTEITLHQPDFGIKPFSAALGALKIKPDVRVALIVPRT